MSLHQSTPVPVPSLPPELWLSIIDFATYVPEIMEPDIYDYADAGLRKQRLRRLLKTSLVTKRSIVRVCRFWNHIGTPYLYEALYIRLERMLPLLSDTLTLSDRLSLNPGSASSLGSQTKRLDIGLHDTYTLSPTELDTLGDIIRRLPNLTIVNVCIPESGILAFKMPAVIVDSVRETCSRSLRVFTWSTSLYMPPEAK
ncbi:hypothetical protein PLICRDRAFT_693472 [Plicaturopsis crispa FD-325 SS-3]|nr:hypothetical protein PLICRDRAFT_693472 [Plicaturopsis crispa FD-325 SS-3]